MSETIGSVTASSSNAMPSSVATRFPTPAPTPIRPVAGKPSVKLGPASIFTLDMLQSVASAQARMAKTKPS
eukprot:11154359-Lingulodinium_polyedra.AAC.1